jgi:hypothetical protein
VALFRRRIRAMERDIGELEQAVIAVCDAADVDRAESEALRTRMSLVERLVTEQQRLLIQTNESLVERLANAAHGSSSAPREIVTAAAAQVPARQPAASQVQRRITAEPPARAASRPAEPTQSTPTPRPLAPSEARSEPVTPSARPAAPSAAQPDVTSARPVAAPNPTAAALAQPNPQVSQSPTLRPTVAPAAPVAGQQRAAAVAAQRPVAPAPASPAPVAAERPIPPAAVAVTSTPAPAAVPAPARATLPPPTGPARKQPTKIESTIIQPTVAADGTLTYLRDVSENLVRTTAEHAASIDGLRVRQTKLEVRVDQVDQSVPGRIAAAHAATMGEVDQKVQAGLDELQEARIRIANEQARFEIATHDEIASVIDRFRSGA